MIDYVKTLVGAALDFTSPPIAAAYGRWRELTESRQSARFNKICASLHRRLKRVEVNLREVPDAVLSLVEECVNEVLDRPATDARIEQVSSMIVNALAGHGVPCSDKTLLLKSLSTLTDQEVVALYSLSRPHPEEHDLQGWHQYNTFFPPPDDKGAEQDRWAMIRHARMARLEGAGLATQHGLTLFGTLFLTEFGLLDAESDVRAE